MSPRKGKSHKKPADGWKRGRPKVPPPVCDECKNPMKYCGACLKWKPLSEFATYRRKYTGPWIGEAVRTETESYCIRCQNLKKQRHLMVQSTGITPEERLHRIEQAGGRCAICGLTKARMCIDHDHKTGIIRGVLCNDCNLALGGFDDDPRLLSSALNYLTNFAKKEN